MKVSRRDFMKLGGVTMIAVAGGTVLRAIDQGVFSAGQGIAYEPWKNWKEATSPLERIVAAGILASNPHNSQPWIFKITDSSIDMFADPMRQIGVIDPFRREMYIGLGCAIENMTLSAEAEGFSADITLMPDPSNTTHVARLALTNSTVNVSKLYKAIPNRHTDRGKYDTTRAVSMDVLNNIDALISEPDLQIIWFHDAAGHAHFSEVAIAGAEALIADEQQSMDSHAWWRQDWDELQKNADGITLDAQALGPIAPIAKILPDLSRQQNDAAFVKSVREVMLPTASAFGIMVIKDRMNNTQRLNCGRAWQRIHLWGTVQGFALQPLNQMCERVDREIQLGGEKTLGEAVRSLVNDDAWQAVMPFRIGYPAQTVNPSPRRGLEKVITA